MKVENITALGGVVRTASASSISMADRGNLPYIATASRDLAELAQRTGLNTLAYLLEIVAIEAERTRTHSTRRNNKPSQFTAANDTTEKILPESALGIYHATAIAHRHLQHAAEIVEGTVIERRVSLRRIAAAERVISRRQTENRRLLKRLTKKAS